METWTIRKLLDWTTEYLKKYNVEWPHLEAEILLAHTLGLKRIQLYTQFEKIVPSNHLSIYKSYLERRSKLEPIAYIINNKPFMSLDFYVDQNVLIPRPETEQLVEIVIDTIKSLPITDYRLQIADIGTGSGCIAISIAKYLPNVKVIGIDSSEEAIKIAQKNAETHQVADRCEFRVGNLLESLTEKVDIIVSNPPYIKTKDIEGLQTEVKVWEPRHALAGGEDGLDYIKKLLATAPIHLSINHGILLVELAFDQGEKVRQLAEETKKYSVAKILKDLNGKERIFSGKVNL